MMFFMMRFIVRQVVAEQLKVAPNLTKLAPIRPNTVIKESKLLLDYFSSVFHHSPGFAKS